MLLHGSDVFKILASDIFKAIICIFIYYILSHVVLIYTSFLQLWVVYSVAAVCLVMSQGRVLMTSAGVFRVVASCAN